MQDLRLFKMQPVRAAAPAAQPQVLNSYTNLLFPRQNRPASQLLLQSKFGNNLRIQRLRNCAAKHSHNALLVVSRDEGLKELPAVPKPPPPSNLEAGSGNASEGKYHGGPSTLTLPLGDREITIETGKIGRQASGAVMVRDGDTMVYTTACVGEETTEAGDFVPLTVNYQEKFSAAGRTSGGYFKREGKPKDHEVLVCRLIDRPIRPMVAKGFCHETQLLVWVLSYDGKHSADALSITAAGAALAVSDIPLSQVVAGVRVGLVEGQLVVNPTVQQMASSQLDMVLAGTKEAVLMIEGYCNFLSEAQLLQAVTVGHEAVTRLCVGIEEWAAVVGKPKRVAEIAQAPPELKQKVEALLGSDLGRALKVTGKKARGKEVHALQERVLKALTGGGVGGKDKDEELDDGERLVDEERDAAGADVEDDVSEGEGLGARQNGRPRQESERVYSDAQVKAAFKHISSREMRRQVVEEGIRSDGRGPRDVRPIDSSCGFLPRVHGSALFTRGETQAIAVATLGGDSMSQRLDNLTTTEEYKRFYLQYSFPPCSVGEVGRVGGQSRREIGHGTLAERALEPAFPSRQDFPYSVRVESTITESNGSSSMASVCGGCLAMEDAGVPLKRRVAGVAMGLILDTSDCGGDGEPLILTDILGSEDALGDMDFKVAGGEEGVTAFQMDIKVEGITIGVLEKALAQAREGRLHILGEMSKCNPAPAGSRSRYAPQIETIHVPPSKVSAVIGSGGKTIKALAEEEGVESIDVEDDGTIQVVGTNQEAVERVLAKILGLTTTPDVGKVYRGCVVKTVVQFGCFLEIAPGKEGLCHISEMDVKRVSKAEEFVKEGDVWDVKLIEINPRGQLRLSRKAVLIEDDPSLQVEEKVDKTPLGAVWTPKKEE